MNKRRYLLAASLVLLLLSAGYCLSSLPTHQGSPPPQPGISRQSRQAANKGPSISLPRVQLELLADESGSFAGSGVNLFRSLQTAVPGRAAIPRPQPALPAEPDEEPDFEIEQEPLPPSLVYLGQVRHDNGQTVFLRQEDEVFLVREGQTFGSEEEFRIIAIRPEMLLLAWNGSDIPLQIPLVAGASRSSRYF